jgi:hypothetical protein
LSIDRKYPGIPSQEVSPPAKPRVLGCELLEAAETALSGSESGLQSESVPLLVFQLSAIPEFDGNPDSHN